MGGWMLCAMWGGREDAIMGGKDYVGWTRVEVHCDRGGGGEP